MTEERLKRLLQSLTLSEKIGQLIQLSGDFFTEDEAMKVGPKQKLGIHKEMLALCGSVLNVTGAEKVKKIQKAYLEKSRHKIPLLFMGDVVYGYKTVYPIPLGLGATWEPELIREDYRLVAEEAKAAGLHVTFSPMVDLVRDARWGRCLESPGEDPWLNSRFAQAMVEGFQGKALNEKQGIAACVKHFAAYGAPEGGREYNTVDISRRRLMEEYLPPYKAAVDAGCEMVMTAFNTVEEIPATANQWLMEEVLRKEWGFNGIIITDYAAIQELIAHGVANDEREASLLAMEAGVDVDMKTACYANQLQELVEDGHLSEKKIDQAVWRILCLKNKLGLFEDPYRGADEEEEKRLFCCAQNREAARRTAEEALVLLKNENHTLPLKKDQRVALIGPYGDCKDLIGLWAVHADTSDVTTLKEAMEEILGKEKLLWAKGCDILEETAGLGEFGNTKEPEGNKNTQKRASDEEWEVAIQAAGKADVVVMALGEHARQSGEGGSRTELSIPEIQHKLLEEIYQTGKPIILILFSGRPLVLTKMECYADAVLEAWFPGTEGAHALANVLFGKKNLSGRLSMSFPYSVGQIPIYYNAFQTGRPAKLSGHSSRFTSRYLDCPNEPLYPFGYGLSYHESVYQNLTLDKSVMKKGDVIEASIEVENISRIDGIETIQMYIRDVTGSVVRPVKELKGFQKIELRSGERKKVCFRITEELLRFYTKDMRFESEPGRFIVMVGKNSVETESAEFVLEV